jgi:cell division protein FtsZ
MSAGVPAPGATPAVELTPAARAVEENAGDELLLGSDTVVPSAPGGASQPPVQPRVFGEDEAAAPRRRWLAGGSDAAEEVPAQPRVKLGGTLFERMQNASRGTPRGEEEEGKDALDIPRFLHRQNNQ